ncbi:MAG: hypothetical protein IIV10_02065 [Alistipes sp.]|nr:hypothetical protein [Alistipes sp.]
MKRFIVIIALLVSTSLYAQEFQPGSYDFINFQVLSSNTNSEVKPALVLFLHGRHASGSDNTAQINQPAVRAIAEFITTNNIPAYLLVPQCPSDYEWLEGRDSPGCINTVLGLLKQCLSEKDIDTNKIYLCGTSMGSWAAWSILSSNPHLFAAAFLASGMPRGINPQTLTSTPIKVTVGSEERSFERLKEFTSDIKDAGGCVDFEVLLGCDHPHACRTAYTPKRLKWIFEQVRTTHSNKSHRKRVPNRD